MLLTVGLAETLAVLVIFSPDAGSQLYPVGPEAASIAIPPEQMVAFEIAIGGGVVTVTLTVAVTSLHPLVEPIML